MKARTRGLETYSAEKNVKKDYSWNDEKFKFSHYKTWNNKRKLGKTIVNLKFNFSKPVSILSWEQYQESTARHQKQFNPVHLKLRPLVTLKCDFRIIKVYRMF